MCPELNTEHLDHLLNNINQFPLIIVDLGKQANTWMKDFDGSVSTTGSNVLLKDGKIKLRRNHFCLWAFIGMCTLEVQIRPYIQNDLLQTDTVTLKVFAIKACDVKVSICVL